MGRSIEGFWQVVIEDPTEDIIDAEDTTIAVRAAGCWIYAGGHFMELWAQKDRAIISDWPPNETTAARILHTNRALAGRFRSSSRP